MSQESIVIASMARTPMGGLMGALGSEAAATLGSAAIGAAVERAGLQPADIEEVIMGNVLMAGQGQAPGRQAALGAGLPNGVTCTTINKMCGSGMKAIMMAHDAIKAGSASIMVAGGMESMTQAPYLLPKGRGGLRLGHGEIKDHMMLDGLEDAYDRGRPMGHFAEHCVEKYGFTREQQDAFAQESLKRARRANEDGSFDAEMVPVTVKTRKGETVVDKDEQPFSANPDKIPSLRPVFKKDGSITAGNASSISDGASALVLMTESEAEKRGIKPLARIIAHAGHAQEPGWFTTAPVKAMENLNAKTGWKNSDVDLFEINEAFACVAMAAMKEHGLSHDVVNVNGGACALGHPIGASGARIVATLLGALQGRNGKRGVASLCIGGGEATALAVELL